jgi:hypothetical protein
MNRTDLLGRPLTEAERELVDAFERLHAIARRTDLAPCASAAVKFALAAMFQAVNDLGLVYEPTDDVGV